MAATRGIVLEGLLFDIDGTLVDSDPTHFLVFQELLLREPSVNGGLPIDHAFFRERISGRQNLQIMSDLFPAWEPEAAAAWSLQKEARFRERAAATMLASKAAGLDKLRAWADARGLPRCAVTNAPRLNAEAILKGIGYWGWFGDGAELVIGDECARAKPDPLPYVLGAGKLGVPPERCIVFEDSPAGARAGHAAGCTVVGLMSGNSREALSAAGCALVVSDFDSPELWAFLGSCST